MKNYTLLLFCLIPFFNYPDIFSQLNDRVSVRQETQVLSKGTKSIFRCDFYYDRDKDALVTHHYYPVEFVKMANRFGETKIYFPGTNTVSIRQSDFLSTTNELLYYFFNNKITDLGLSKEGFKLIQTNREDGMNVTVWQAPPTVKTINEVKIVFKDMVPIYAEYIGADGFIWKKIYYSRYSEFKSFTLPMRITEISFTSKADSTIQLSVFSNVRTENFPDTNYFNFKIPEDAEISK